MTYHLTKTVTGSMDEVAARVTEALAKRGFGVLTTIDVQATLKKKLGVDFRPYRILGACNPNYAFEALQAEDKIGTMLPCNDVLQEKERGRIEVSAVDPVASMASVDQPKLAPLAQKVRGLLAETVESL